MSRLYESRKKMPLFGQALLLHALSVSKQKREMIDQLAGEVEGQLHLDANMAFANENLGDDYAVLMDSSARTSALVLRALVVRPTRAPDGDRSWRAGCWRCARAASGARPKKRPSRSWRSISTGAPKRRSSRTTSRASGSRERSSRRPRCAGDRSAAVSHRIPTAKLGAGGTLVFEKQGSGTLFYEARLKYARTTLPAAPLDRGFFVQKTLRKVTPETLADAMKTVPDVSLRALAGGDLVMVDVVVVTPSPRHFVAIDDPLPAGLEAVDANLSNTAAWLRIPDSGGRGR